MIKYTGKDIGKSKQILPVWNNDALFREGFFFFPQTIINIGRQ